MLGSVPVPVPGGVPVPVPGAVPVPVPGGVPVPVPGAVPVPVPGPVDSENDSSDDDVVFVGVVEGPEPRPLGHPRKQLASKVGFRGDPPVGGLRAPPPKKRAHDPQAHPGCRATNDAMHSAWPVDKKRKRR